MEAPSVSWFDAAIPTSALVDTAMEFDITLSYIRHGVNDFLHK
jgi:hypothetical protein